jgi:hypothetical protein
MRPAFLGLFCSAVALVSLALVAAVASGGGPATASAGAGLSYGARTVQGETLWIRLRPNRQSIASLELGWQGTAGRCTNGETFYSATYAGGENAQAIPVKAGQFRKQLSDRYHEGRTSIVEKFQIQGRIDGARAVGQFTVEVRARRPDGSGYTCNVGPIPFTAVNRRAVSASRFRPEAPRVA